MPIDTGAENPNLKALHEVVQRQITRVRWFDHISGLDYASMTRHQGVTKDIQTAMARINANYDAALKATTGAELLELRSSILGDIVTVEKTITQDPLVAQKIDYRIRLEQEAAAKPSQPTIAPEEVHPPELSRIPASGTLQERIAGAVANKASAAEVLPLIQQLTPAEYAPFYVENKDTLIRFFAEENASALFVDSHAKRIRGSEGDAVRQEIAGLQAPKPSATPAAPTEEALIADIKRFLGSYDTLTPQQALMADDELLAKVSKIGPEKFSALLSSDEAAATIYASRLKENPRIAYTPLLGETAPAVSAAVTDEVLLADIKRLLGSYHDLTPQQALMTDDELLAKVSKIGPEKFSALLHADEAAATVYANRLMANPRVAYAPLLGETLPADQSSTPAVPIPSADDVLLADIKRLLSSYHDLTPQQALMTDDELITKLSKLPPEKLSAMLYADEAAALIYASRLTENPHIAYASLLAEAPLGTTPPAAPEKAPATSSRWGAASAGAGAGMAAYGLIANREIIGEDFDAGGARALASGARVTADIGSIGLGAATVARPTSLAPLGVKIGLPLAIASGAFESYAAAQEGDRARGARAIGGTGGGLIAGIASGVVVGAATGSPSGPGAIATGFIGGIAGAYYGADKMEEIGQGIAGAVLGIDKDIALMISQSTPTMRKTLGLDFQGNYNNRSEVSDADIEKVYAYLKQSGIDGVSHIDRDKNGLESLDLFNLMQENKKLEQGVATLDKAFIAPLDGNKDGKIDLAEIRRAANHYNVNIDTLDKNGDRIVSGEELGSALIANAQALHQVEKQQSKSSEINFQTIGKLSPEQQTALAWYVVNTRAPSAYKGPDDSDVQRLANQFKSYPTDAVGMNTQNAVLSMQPHLKVIHDNTITVDGAVAAFNAAKGKAIARFDTFIESQNTPPVTVTAPQTAAPQTTAPQQAAPASTPANGKRADAPAAEAPKAQLNGGMLAAVGDLAKTVAAAMPGPLGAIGIAATGLIPGSSTSPSAAAPTDSEPKPAEQAGPPAQPETKPAATGKTYTITNGDSLSNIIAKEYEHIPNNGFGYIMLREAIKTANPEMHSAIVSGDKFKLTLAVGTQITLPSEEQVRDALKNSNINFDAAQKEICAALNCPATGLKQAAEKQGISFAQ